MPTKMRGMKELERHLNTVLQQAPRAVGSLAVNHFKDSFRLQRFNDKASPRWPVTKSGKSSGILIGKQSGRLRNSIRVTRASLKEVRIGTDVDYARIHNEGGEVHPRVTPKMRKFAWAMSYKAKGAEKEKWKGLALTKKSKLDIRIPQRKFMGRSSSLNRTIENWFKRKLNFR